MIGVGIPHNKNMPIPLNFSSKVFLFSVQYSKYLCLSEKEIC